MSDITHTSELVEINPPTPFVEGPRAMWRNALSHRHLIANFIRRDFRLKYRNSSLGYLWSLLEPLMLSGIYFLLHVILTDKPDAKAPLWIYLGAVTWGFFAKGFVDALTCLTSSESMIKQVYFPREIFAITGVGSQLLMATLSLPVAVPLMLYFGVSPSWHLLLVPVGLLLAAMLALGAGLCLACVNVVNRDVEHFLRFVIRAGFFLSPVMWRLESIPEARAALRDYVLLNPMAVPLTMVRNGVDGDGLSIVPIGYVAYSVAICTGTLLLGSMIFKRFEARMVQRI